MVRGLVEELKPVAREPGQFLTKLNGDLYSILKHTGTPLLTTAFYLVADCKTGAMQYANAGHPKPLHLRRAARQVQPLANSLGKGQAALGLMDDTVYQRSDISIEPGDMILLFTDGLYEVEGANNEIYSQAMLLEGVQRRLQHPAAQLFDELLDEVRGFSAQTGFADDVCLVAVELAAKT